MSRDGLALALVGLGLLLGSIPFAPILARLLLGVDLRDVGDGNPGATNVGRAGGRLLGLLAAGLDIAKGALPVGIGVGIAGIGGAWIVALVAAPVVAHVWSPWLGGRGGKGTATSYGALIPLTLPLGPVLMPVALLLAYRFLAPDGWAPVVACAVLGAWLLATGAAPAVLAALGVVVAILATRYRDDLGRGIHRRRRSAPDTARTGGSAPLDAGTAGR